MLVPQVLLLGGRVFVAPDPVQGVRDEIGAVPQFLLQAVLTAGLLGSLTALVAAAHAAPGLCHRDRSSRSRSSRRSSSDLVGNLANQDSARLLVLFSPGDILDGTNAWIFGAIPDSPIVASARPARLACTWARRSIGIVVATGLTIRRYLTIRA